MPKRRCAMKVWHTTTCFTRCAAAAVAVLALAGYSSLAAGQDAPVTLSGSQEVPAVSTSASGTGMISVAPDKSVSGSVTTSGLTGTGAHIHAAATGQNGPVIIPLTKSGDNTWSVPPGTKLTDAQYESFKAGNLYVNVHSAANPAGQVRGQLMMGKMGMIEQGTGNQPVVDRPTGTSLTVPYGTDGKPLGQTTNFGQR
jgi:CHRD domain